MTYKKIWLLFLSNLFFFQFGIFPLDNGCNPEYVKCAFGVANVVPCDIGLVYQGSAHACNYPDLLIQELSCDPSALLGGFVCPNPQELQGKEFYRPELFELTKTIVIHISLVVEFKGGGS